jgi:hypothetical protein
MIADLIQKHSGKEKEIIKLKRRVESLEKIRNDILQTVNQTSSRN